MPPPDYLPNYNLTFDYWRPPHKPSTHTPFGTIVGQLYIASKGLVDIQPSDNWAWVPPIYIRVGVLDRQLAGIGVGAFLGNGLSGPVFYWRVRWWEYTHLGFPNQYVSLLVEQVGADGSTPDPARDALPM